MKMSGIVLEDAAVVQAMERDARAVFVPAAIDKEGRPNGSVVTEQQLTLLRGVVEKLLVDMANTLLDGDIAASPLKTGQHSPCDYCDYRTVCARDEDAAVRELPKQSMDEVLEELEKEVSDDE
jgi:ATP-dependent helicase/nuclease subunit B